MRKFEQHRSFSSLGVQWRHVLLLLVIIGSLTGMLLLEPFGQDPAYHNFADQRELLGIPNFLDVISNLPFLLVGIAGVVLCSADRTTSRAAWLTLFAGVAMVSAGSAYYHVRPDNQTLVWDRLPMTVGFMGLFVALLGEYVSTRLGRYLLAPAILLGFFSVFYWHWFDDLRFYYWIQLIPLLTIPLVMTLFRSRYSHKWVLLVALSFYVLAKISEVYDREIFVRTNYLFSGHTLKHLLAAAGCFAVLLMLKLRKPADHRSYIRLVQSS